MLNNNDTNILCNGTTGGNNYGHVIYSIIAATQLLPR